MNKVQEQFGNAMGADDFMQRVEMALYAFGFNGDNSIGACGGWLGAALAGGWVLPKWGEHRQPLHCSMKVSPSLTASLPPPLPTPWLQPW